MVNGMVSEERMVLGGKSHSVTDLSNIKMIWLLLTLLVAKPSRLTSYWTSQPLLRGHSTVP